MARKTAAAMSSSTPACLRWPKPRVRRDETRMPSPISAKRTPIRNLVCSTICILYSPISSPRPFDAAQDELRPRSCGDSPCLTDTRPRPVPGRRVISLARETFVIVRRLQLDLPKVGRVVGLDPAGEAGALHRLGAQIIEAFDAELPGAV